MGKLPPLGSTKEILSLAGPHTLLADLEGNSVLPGFIDSHCHLLATGQAYEQLGFHGCRSAQEMVTRGREFIQSRCLPAGAWVVGEVTTIICLTRPFCRMGRWPRPFLPSIQ